MKTSVFSSKLLKMTLKHLRIQQENDKQFFLYKFKKIFKWPQYHI